MVANRPDWCISRQRSWGVPIPIFYCKACGKEFFEEKAFEHLKSLVAQRGVDIWFTREPGELLPEGVACACGSVEFVKEEDILDVWFESGVSHRAVLETTEGLHFPSDLYVEGSDQHRGWFQSSLLPAVAVKGRAPYDAVLTHGYVVTSDGKKMSKKLGNAIYPDEVIEKYGADVLRLWTASENFTQDIRVSFEILQRLADAYRRLRNTFKFLLSNLYDFDPVAHAAPYERMNEIDQWALHALQQVIERVTRAYEEHEFYTAFHSLYNYCAVELSSLYLDMLKDRLYTFAPDNPARRSSQTALNIILHALTRMLAPMLAFTAEEVWRSIPNQPGLEQSVHLACWPEVERRFVNHELGQRWEALLKLRSGVTKALETARRDGLLGNSLEASIALYPERTEEESLLRGFLDMLPTIFIVSGVEVHACGEALPGDISAPENYLAVAVRKASGKKCKRCWNYRETVGDNEEHPCLCERCVNELRSIGGTNE
jgi:isoleucyl-tRNA synthetase